ncbi:TetR/AcrR family transcriptional regulator [Prosthecomicrobium sp. N25]|uniref:TetR/AcrR family transcriptional regulator n=1 Tax=Prosthecomicrobium sp. N25 TaxID=3129254 RepID=UPI0030769ADF
MNDAVPTGAGRPRRRRYDSAATAAAILEAAYAEFAEHGFGGGRMDRIAARAAANKRSIYQYFQSKENLYLAVLEHAYERTRSGERAIAVDELAPREAMVRLVELTFDGFVADRSFIKLLNDENLHRAAHLKRSKRIAEMHSPLIAAVARILERGAAEGAFRPGLDPLQTWISIAAAGYFYFSNLHTLSTIFRRDFDAPAAREERRRHVVDLILSYVSA